MNTNTWKRYAALVNLVSQAPYDANITLDYTFEPERFEDNTWGWTITVKPTPHTGHAMFHLGAEPITASAEDLDHTIDAFRRAWSVFLTDRARALRTEAAEVRDALQQMKQAA